VDSNTTSEFGAALDEVAGALKEARAREGAGTSWSMFDTLQGCAKAAVSHGGLASHLLETPKAFMALWSAFLYGELYESVDFDVKGPKYGLANGGTKYIIGETKSSTTGKLLLLRDAILVNLDIRTEDCFLSIHIQVMSRPCPAQQRSSIHLCLYSSSPGSRVISSSRLVLLVCYTIGRVSVRLYSCLFGTVFVEDWVSSGVLG
jgi:hypothetical protein